MKTVGIIAEFNPFHNGHKYIINKAKELTGADNCIIIMSGDFVQRGTPACMNKYLRTEVALKNGADLVLELPVYYATSDAGLFASGAVALLDKIACIDYLVFGSEDGELSPYLSIASYFKNGEPKQFKENLLRNLSLGISYPKAMEAALQELFSNFILDTPNNILAFEYIKALSIRKSSITPYTIKRYKSSYHNPELDGTYSSATAIRNSLQEDHFTDILTSVPDNCIELLRTHYQIDYPISSNDFSHLLHYKLIQELKNSNIVLGFHPEWQYKEFTESSSGMTRDGVQKNDFCFCKYQGINLSLNNKLIHNLRDFTDMEGYITMLKSKDLTYTSISRGLLHILLSIYSDDIREVVDNDYIFYARILGFRKDKTDLLSSIKKNSSIPLLSKAADFESILTNLPNSDLIKRMLAADITASHIYNSTVQNKYQEYLPNEFKRQLVLI